jgi:site-specific recombinase XerD
MAKTEYALVPLFEKFIRYSYNGKRLKHDGGRIKEQTVDNYRYVLRYLQEYQLLHNTELRVKVIRSNNRRLLKYERNYWKKFYLQFTNYLYFKRNFFDNYVGTVIKIVRNFFHFVNDEFDIATGNYYKTFYVCKEEIPVITLMPRQLYFLITNKAFEESLSRSLRKTKDIFVVGCTIALRVSDLFALRFSDLEEVEGSHYIHTRTIKTASHVRVKLPGYAVAIIEKFRSTARRRRTVFPPIPRTRFNQQLKDIALLAGWTSPITKERSKRGVYELTAGSANEQPSRFCDIISSHVMRRTAITTMLMMGMKEPAVRKISGHTDNSKYFYRYVNLVQSYLDNEVDVAFSRLMESCQTPI